MKIIFDPDNEWGSVKSMVESRDIISTLEQTYNTIRSYRKYEKQTFKKSDKLLEEIQLTLHDIIYME